MQFKVPQNVQREDHIVGPLTLKQLIICGIGGTVAYAIYVSLAKSYLWITWFPPVALVAGITLAFAFFRPLDMSLARWILTGIEFYIIPRQRYWIQGAGEVIATPLNTKKTPSKIEKKAEAKAENIIDKHKKIEEITKILNSNYSKF